MACLNLKPFHIHQTEYTLTWTQTNALVTIPHRSQIVKIESNFKKKEKKNWDVKLALYEQLLCLNNGASRTSGLCPVYSFSSSWKKRTNKKDPEEAHTDKVRECEWPSIIEGTKDIYHRIYFHNGENMTYLKFQWTLLCRLSSSDKAFIIEVNSVR